MLKSTTICLFLALLVFVPACKDPYISPYKSPPTGYLVVEGYISGNTTTQFSLTRSIPLPGDSALPVVNDVSVEVQASDSSVYPLVAHGGGIYSSANTLPLNPQLQYRLRIKTPNGEQYLSDFVPYKQTPPIDSVNFVENGDNSIHIYANTHDPADNTHYYMWNYSQIYEYHSAEYSTYYYDKDTVPPAVIPRLPDQLVERCWTSSNSTNILVGSSTKLAHDVIYEQPMKTIPPNDVQTSVLYTILVKQYALTLDGYNFLTQMQKNSESLGSVFDAQPTQLSSNIHNAADPTEPVIGFVSAGTVQEQRLWIYRNQIKSAYTYMCPIPDSVILPVPKLIMSAFSDGYLTPIDIDPTTGGWNSNVSLCVNCLLRGGTNVMPSIWPN